MNTLDHVIVRKLGGIEWRLDSLEALEFASSKDPIWALTRFMRFLASRPGPRAIWGNFNANLFPNGKFTLTPVNHSSSYPMAYQDTTRLYPYTRLRDAQGQYLYNNSENNLWTVDPGVVTWNATPGLTAGIWVKFSGHPADTQGLLADWSPAGIGMSWAIYLNNAGSPVNNLNFSVSTDGSSVAKNVAGSYTLPTSRWVLVLARWTPSTEMKTWIYDAGTVETAVSTSGIPASLFNSTGTHYGFLGNYQTSGPTDHTINADIGLAWFHVSAQTDDEIAKSYHISRHIYGV